MQLWEDKRKRVGGALQIRVELPPNATLINCGMGLKHSDGEGLQELERPNEIVNDVFGPQCLR